MSYTLMLILVGGLLFVAWSLFMISLGLHYGCKWTREDLAISAENEADIARALEPAWLPSDPEQGLPVM